MQIKRLFPVWRSQREVRFASLQRFYSRARGTIGAAFIVTYHGK